MAVSSDLKVVPVVGPFAKGFDALVQGKVHEAANELQGATKDLDKFSGIDLDKASTLIDPLSKLVNMGLGFLINHCEPLREALSFITGDGKAVGAAALEWRAISTELTQVAESLQTSLTTDLGEWSGQAASAAAETAAELITAIHGMADRAENVDSLLIASAALMDAALAVVKSMISDLVSWLIMTWLAAQAAAIPTLGASEAVALEATIVEVAITEGRVSYRVTLLVRDLTKLEQIIVKISNLMKTEKMALSSFMKAKSVAALESQATKVGDKLLDEGTRRAVGVAGGRDDVTVSEREIDEGLTIG